MSKGGSYMLYVLGFILILFPLLATKMLRGEIGDFYTKLILSVGCVIVALGKLNMIRLKRQEGERVTNDIIVAVALVGLAVFNMVR